MSSEISCTKGDMLGFKRGIYWHYALYIGVHKGVPMVINIPGSKGEGQTKIELVPLDTVVQGCRTEIRNNDDYAKKVYNREPRTPDEIVAAAMEFVTANTFWPYEFLQRNCEFYTSFFRYGEGFSTQVDTVKNVALGVGVAGAIGALGILAYNLAKKNKKPKPRKRLQH